EPRLNGIVLCRQGDVEGGAGAVTGLEPDAAAVTLDDAPHDRQAHPLARGGVRVQSLERLENLAAVRLGNAAAVVAHAIGPQAIRARTADFHRARTCGLQVIQ